MLSPKENGSHVAAKENHTKADYYSSPFGRYTTWLAMLVSNPNQLLYGASVASRGIPVLRD
jgi:hypothetical protein